MPKKISLKDMHPILDKNQEKKRSQIISEMRDTITEMQNDIDFNPGYDNLYTDLGIVLIYLRLTLNHLMLIEIGGPKNGS